ncbi:protein of unknown function [Petrocella atlantisensis]|uniref:Uncharacterized protein n=1 Tax=Petrocella atlantisensis TaxID=2173034 RepID=A0A3P7NYH0_9FIRM|nr:protein of unknown function [Petrocella atlantisensis]
MFILGLFPEESCSFLKKQEKEQQPVRAIVQISIYKTVNIILGFLMFVITR